MDRTDHVLFAAAHTWLATHTCAACAAADAAAETAGTIDIEQAADAARCAKARAVSELLTTLDA